MFKVTSINRQGREEVRKYQWIGDARAMAKYLRAAGHQYVDLWDMTEQTSLDIDAEGSTNYA